MNYLEEYYKTYDEEGRLLSRHGQVEYLTTMKYINEYLPDIGDPKILEVGAGTGRYSITLAKQGRNVTAVELVEHNLEVLKSKLDGTELIRVTRHTICLRSESLGRSSGSRYADSRLALYQHA